MNAIDKNIEAEEAKNDSIKPGKYRHYKGGLYEVIAVGKHSETLEDMVIYRALYEGGRFWVRPAYMWSQTVKTENGIQKRFEYVEG